MAIETRLIERAEIGDLWVLRLEKPHGYAFTAGQHCVVEVPDLGLRDPRGLRRPLSIAAAPEEHELIFATKRSASAFKGTLGRLSPGDVLNVGEPRGTLTLPPGTAAPLVFVAGGVGITPFRSMLKHASLARTGHRITLFYSNRTPEEAPFLDDLVALSGAAAELRVVATMTRMAESSRPWAGLTGRLGADMLRRHCPYWQEAEFFLAGPPAMVEAAEETLQELGIPPERVRLERFGGY